eukprot:1326176-Amphidinium_carterae.1
MRSSTSASAFRGGLSSYKMGLCTPRAVLGGALFLREPRSSSAQIVALYRPVASAVTFVPSALSLERRVAARRE